MSSDLLLNTYRILTSGTLSAFLFAGMFLVSFHFLIKHRGPHPPRSQTLFFWFLAISVLQLVLLYADLWFEWHRSSCGASCTYFFPPYSNYYFNEIMVRWLGGFAFNASVGLLGGLIFLWFSKKTHGRIIDQLDVDFLTVGGMVAGWPNILVFYALIFILTIIVTIVRSIVERSAAVRMIITPVLPLACAAIALFGDQLSRLAHVYEIGVTFLYR